MTETESRIRYDSFEDETELRYNPHEPVTPWEVWTNGERTRLGDEPTDLLEIEDGTEYKQDGKPLHELRPERYPSREVIAARYPEPAMDLDVVPSVDIQKAVWDALKSTTERYESVDLYEFCEETGTDLNEAERASKLLMIQGLVEYASVDFFPFLTSEGQEYDRPKWVYADSFGNGQQEERDR